MLKLTRMRTLFFFIVLSALLPQLGFSQTEKSRLKHLNTRNELAIKGYDPVAYFTEQKAVKGSPKYAAVHEGITYHFSTTAHRDTFLLRPAQYEPQYGGWCAYAMGINGEKVDINPETFKITDGKLYLFYNAYLNNTLKPWNKNETKLRAKADQYWAKTLK